MRISVILLLSTTVTLSKTSSCTSSVCVNLCCPAGQLHTKQDISEDNATISGAASPLAAPVCSDYEEELSWSPGWPDHVGAEPSLIGERMFSCEKGTLVAAELLFGTEDVKLVRSGELRISLVDLQTNSSLVYKYNSSDFCLAFTNTPDYHDYYYSEGSGLGADLVLPTFPVRATFSVCYLGEEEKGREFTGIFYPIAIFISDFFILITLCVYLFLDDLRVNLFGKITIGFLFNVFFCYLFIGIHYSLDLFRNKHWLDSSFCIFLGYVIQHTFIGFFFWMSAMAIHITRTLSNYFEERKHSNPRRTLLINICYAQGCPLLITIITVMMDNLASPQSFILPNMGKNLCFLGSDHNLETPFHQTPEFLYSYLVITIIMITNIICFLITGASLFAHWWQMRGMAQGSINELFKTQLAILSKLFIIMGIIWTCDIISAAVDHNYGAEKSFEARLMLDILNLLTGVLIFLSLVCKRTVLTSLRTQLAGQGRYSPGTQRSSGGRDREWTFSKKTSSTSF